jgi:hypothetical protein
MSLAPLAPFYFLHLGPRTLVWENDLSGTCMLAVGCFVVVVDSVVVVVFVVVQPASANNAAPVIHAIDFFIITVLSETQRSSIVFLMPPGL